MMVVRAELCDRLDSLQRAAARMNVRDFAQGIGGIRTMAAAYGLVPVVCLADAFERAMHAQPRGCPAGLYFDRLRDAIGCDPAGRPAGEAMRPASIASARACLALLRKPRPSPRPSPASGRGSTLRLFFPLPLAGEGRVRVFLELG